MAANYIKNAHVFNALNGEYVGYYSDLFSDDIPSELRQGKFAVVSEYRVSELQSQSDAVAVMENKIALIQNGELIVNPAEWLKNYNDKK